jgi:hypothetical protein
MHQYSLVQLCKEFILHGVSPLKSCLNIQPTADGLEGILKLLLMLSATLLPHKNITVSIIYLLGSITDFNDIYKEQ